MSYRFTTPYIEEAPMGGGPLFSRYKDRRGISVLKEGSSYREVRYPTDTEVDAATIAYIGGHEYTVTDAEATALTNAGYGSYLTAI